MVVPGALSGILAAFVLAASRAFGETMAVTLAAGATPNLTANPLESIQTMTAYIVQVSLGDTPAGGVEYQTIFAVGSLLFLITLGMNILANRILKKYQEVYERVRATGSEFRTWEDVTNRRNGHALVLRRSQDWESCCSPFYWRVCFARVAAGSI